MSTPPPTNTGNDLAALRAVLFDTLRGVRNGSTDLDQARAVNSLAQTLVDTGRLEVEYARAIGGEISSGFLPEPNSPAGQTQPGIKGTTVHRLR